MEEEKSYEEMRHRFRMLYNGEEKFKNRKIGMEELKRNLMNGFSSIFFTNFAWYKYVNNNVIKTVNRYKDLNILNPFPYIAFDDMITAYFRGVRLEIEGVNTDVFDFRNLLMLVSAILFLVFYGMCTAFLIAVILVLAKSLPVNVVYAIVLAVVSVAFLLLIRIFLNYQSIVGVIVEFELKTKLTGHTFFLENSRSAKQIKFDKNVFKEIKLSQSKFAEKFKVYTDNEAEARMLLDGAMAERISYIFAAYKAKFVRGAFKDGKFVIAINCGRDIFDVRPNKKESHTAKFTRLFEEIVSILYIVDELKQNSKTGL